MPSNTKYITNYIEILDNNPDELKELNDEIEDLIFYKKAWLNDRQLTKEEASFLVDLLDELLELYNQRRLEIQGLSIVNQEHYLESLRLKLLKLTI